MKFSLAAVTALLAVAQTVTSTAVITQPVASTDKNGGSRLTIEWHDDNKAPTLKDWGDINIYLAAGSQNVQFKLQEVAAGVKSTATSRRFKIDPSIGETGQYYFIRMEGTKLGANNLPPMSFSARFKLDKMTGHFNSTVLAAAKGQEGAASPTAGAAKVSSTSTLSTQRASATPLTGSASANRSSSNTSGSSSAAGIVLPAHFLSAAAGIGAAAVGAVMLL
ncbi:hypothetical protein IE81DRAFT_325512 [Ceraceosorus guamensis]|uniref:Yeast cell wall synthesis Kre9/Knh1-like N-terminal domain-containing protein n=1 Tax=Ceraceosorus guamensis TaxID=1522189 RepID=A0A316VT10_9BASI|nr:hypothetical protein IE81DRAFT_325512 [Ceraceosorus guamensis]PWN40510.1 hypothetical protein IE81DRAFT_325512 [Ceraceosorus guamensis]